VGLPLNQYSQCVDNSDLLTDCLYMMRYGSACWPLFRVAY